MDGQSLVLLSNLRVLTDALDLDSTAWDTPYVFAEIGLMKRDLAMLGYDLAME